MTREGSGNFLTETYISLRKLENEILKELYGQQIVMGISHNPIQISINQFYGIEINDFAVSVARTALWIAESQMMKETEDIVNMNLDFLPLKTYPNIVEGNALRLDWEDVVPKEELDYIMGNPPFVGTVFQSKNQKEETRKIFGTKAKLKNLDYVANWFIKSLELLNQNANIRVAFVSTNSISQGEQVETLWNAMFNADIKIDFAHETFRWDSEATAKAAVHCIIIGYSKKSYYTKEKYIFSSDGAYKKVNNINPYLVEAENIIVKSSRNSLWNLPKMTRGNQPTEGGNLLLSRTEKEEMIRKNPETSKWIKKFMGAREFIQRQERYCLWFADADMREVRKYPDLMDRINKVREMRLLSSDVGTRKKAEIPWLFRETNNPKEALVIPRVSSENRKYVPIGYVDNSIILSDAVQMVPEGDLSLFSLLTSNVHMAWMRTVAGRLKSDYRYSIFLVYNTFPVEELSKEQKNILKLHGLKILEARDLYPDWSLADLYDELTMPSELRRAHQENDKAVMEIYGFDWRTMTEAKCVSELMKRYNDKLL